MSMLTEDELADLRADMLELMPDTLTISRPSEATNGYGEAVKTWATVATVAGRIDPMSDREKERVVADAEKGLSYHRITVAYDADLRDGDRVIGGGITYEITTLYANHSMRATRRAVGVRFG